MYGLSGAADGVGAGGSGLWVDLHPLHSVRCRGIAAVPNTAGRRLRIRGTPTHRQWWLFLQEFDRPKNSRPLIQIWIKFEHEAGV
ncbi:hypothetical protein Pelo_6710 [Pelomyxa schiedti]|nr:hypothetical protein Pelo_6710 [Pelomyxa schiedti]